MGKFDIRHKEVLRLFLPEYFALFFPKLAKRMNFDTAVFLDKELLALLDKPLIGKDKDKDNSDMQRVTDALILIEIELDGAKEWMLIYWEQQSKREGAFEKRMFHYFCGIYFKYEKIVFPIAMFTDRTKWKKAIPASFSLSLFDYSIVNYEYRQIKINQYKADEFLKKDKGNPLVAAYLPLTDYKKEERPLIKAKAKQGVASTVKSSVKQAHLMSLIDIYLSLNKKEESIYKNIVDHQPEFKGVKMLQSVEEWGREKGKEEGLKEGLKRGEKKGLEKGLEKTAINLLKSGVLTKEQISEATTLSLKKLEVLATNFINETPAVYGKKNKVANKIQPD